MQRSAAPPAHTAVPFFSSLFGGGGGARSSNRDSHHPHQHRPVSPTTKSHRPASSGEDTVGGSPRKKVLHKERRASSSRRPSFFSASPATRSKRRTASTASVAAPPADGIQPNDTASSPRRPFAVQALPTTKHNDDDDSNNPTLPNPSPKSNARLSKMLSRGAVTPITGYPVAMTGSGSMLGGGGLGQQSELAAVHQHIHETANKRISTLDYLRKAHEGRIYWFNTLLFDKPDLQRMPYFDPRKLGRRATNYLLLGISLPTVVDLNSSTPTEFLRSFNALLAEFDSFQQIHTENGINATSLTRTRIPQMFRRAAAPVSKGRRSSSAAGRDGDMGYSLDHADSIISTTAPSTTTTATTAPAATTTNTAPAGAIGQPVSSSSSSSMMTGAADGSSIIGGSSVLTSAPTTISHATTSTTTATTAATTASTTTTTTTTTTTHPSAPPPPPLPASSSSTVSVMAFGASEVDLLPGEEYTYLVTPTLPFEPDFFETFATLCDALADAYARLLALLPTPRECGGAVAELFAKADGRVRKLLVQGVLREFEESARAGVRAEVANVGKVVLSGLM